jgi:hypothetical protein
MSEHHPRHTNGQFQQTRFIGGTCAKGHRLTYTNIYKNGNRILCVICWRAKCERTRRNRGIQPRYPLPPTPPEKLCRGCGETKTLAQFGETGVNTDGSTRYASWCAPCRSRSSSAKRRAERQERIAQTNEERQFARDWIVASVERLKAKGWTIKASTAAAGITKHQWDTWRAGQTLPRYGTAKVVTENMRVLMVKEGLL